MALAISIFSLFIAGLSFIRDTFISTKVKLRKTYLVNEITTMNHEIISDNITGVGVEITLINKSRNSIDFFDICFKDKATGELLACIDKMALPEYHEQNHFIFKATNGSKSLSSLMHTNNGVLRPYSFIRFETVVFPKGNDVEMTICFPTNFLNKKKKYIQLTDIELANCISSKELSELLQSKSK
ncbi:hypothetical protein [Brochothrix thermosphacta]|nr:hypothetical protein [Brochothrix thermosphacta]ODJ54826.1 hypothetical protein BFR41_06905 [Brochothrix thermosphacta]ODJ66926.1 hypothetical protein BFR37_07340 [Brochothrix thermosphacta]